MTYAEVVEAVAAGKERFNARTGRLVFERRDLCVSSDLRGGVPLPGLRRFPTRIGAAEMAWAVSGEDRESVLEEFGTKVWAPFAESDGRLESAYGARWRRSFGRDQLFLAIEELRQDPSSRQAVVLTWDPRTDGLRTGAGTPRQKQAPCPFALVFGVDADGTAALHVVLRSSDVMLGLPHDIVLFSLLLDAVAASLCRLPGACSLTLVNAHIYGEHMPVAGEALRRGETAGKLPLVRMSVESVVERPYEFLARVEELTRGTSRPNFRGKMSVVL